MSKIQVRPGAPTTSVINGEGIALDWQLLEDSARVIGIAATARKYNVKASTIYARKDSHKWKGIPRATDVQSVEQGSSTELDTTPGDFTRRITAHREKVFSVASHSLGKKKTIQIKNARDYDIVDKIARRAAGISDDDSITANILLHINESIESHEMPIEAHEVIPCVPDSNAEQQSESREADRPKLLVRPTSHVAQSNVSSETLNAGDSRARQFVLPGPAAPSKH